jgi:arylsulfatase A-like enzyme
LNLLLITLDTVRADALTPYGQSLETSPAIERLAREGVVFDQVASSSPLTLPSHATLLTGLFPFVHGVRANADHVLSAERRTLTEVLRESGYRTAAEIAAPVLNASKGLAQGFDTYRDLSSSEVRRTGTTLRVGSVDQPHQLDERPAEDITRFGKRFLSKNRERAFFLWLHYFDAHLEHVRRPEYERRLPQDPYLAEILYLDTHIGELIRHVESLGLRQRTLVVLVADHGEGRGDHGEAVHGFFLYDTTIRVPLILWGPPRLPVGRRVDSLARMVDIAPTVLDLLGLPRLDGIHGESLVPLLEAEREAAPSPVAYGESIQAALVFGGAPLRFLREGDWKYLHQAEPELYDVRADPGELHDRAASEPERVARLRAKLEALLAAAPETTATSEVTLDRGESERLRALGYLDSGRLEPQRLDSLELRGPGARALAADIDRLSAAGGWVRAGLHERAEPVLREFAARYPGSRTIHRDHARTLRALGRSTEAREPLARALEVSPCDAAARVELAEVHAELGDRGAELEVLRAGVGGCGESVELLNNYAYLRATSPKAELRDGAEAVRAARRAIELASDERPVMLDTLAAAHAEAGDFDEAVRVARRAVELARRRRLSPQLVALLSESLAHFERREPLRAP